jgi:hypothetical protein
MFRLFVNACETGPLQEPVRIDHEMSVRSGALFASTASRLKVSGGTQNWLFARGSSDQAAANGSDPAILLLRAESR